MVQSSLFEQRFSVDKDLVCALGVAESQKDSLVFLVDKHRMIRLNTRTI